MPHNEHNVIPFCNKLNDSDGKMRYLPLISSHGRRKRPLLNKVTLAPCSEVTLANVVYGSDNTSTVLGILVNKESGNTQYFI